MMAGAWHAQEPVNFAAACSGRVLSEGLPTPSSGLWEQAQPGGRSAANMQRAEDGRAEASVRREGVGSPDTLGTLIGFT
jgi:hypothetical protein